MSAGSHTADSGTPAGNAPHEMPEVDVGLTLLWAAAIVAGVVVACIISGAIYGAKVRPVNERSLTPLNGEGLSLPAEPRLEGIEMMSGPKEDAVPTATVDRLKTYGWVDREKGVVRIPIQRAMELAVEREWLPSAPGEKNAKAARQHAPGTPLENKSSL